MASGIPVTLYVYDLSGGIANLLSHSLLGRHIEGVWHTSIVVFEREFFFGSQGIQSCSPGSTVLGSPLKQLHLGYTEISYSVLRDYLSDVALSTFRPSAYNLLRHNCNTFSNELADFLCSAQIPAYILDLPDNILNTPIGGAISSLLQGLEASSFSSRDTSPDLHRAIDHARREAAQLDCKRNELKKKLARREKKLKRRQQKELNCNRTVNMGDDGGQGAGVGAGEDVTSVTRKARDVVAEIAEEEAREAAELRKKQQREPPITFPKAVDVRAEFDALVGLIDGQLNPEEQTSLEELHQYMVEGEGSWALGDSFLLFIGRLLQDKSLPGEVRVRTLHVLAAAALKDDVILLLHQDRREHVLMNYAADVEKLCLEEQQALALFFANLFEHQSCSEWLLYISEWTYCNASISNIRVTTRVAVNALLSDVPLLQDRGTAIIHNMACKDVKTVVFDDVAVELTMALLQYLNSNPGEELLFRVMKSLARFCHLSTQEVPQLVQMIGPDPAKFLGASARVDEQISLIQAKLR